MREKADSFGREDPIALIPVVVVAVPRVDVPLAVEGVPVDADDAPSRIPAHQFHYPSICLSGLYRIWGL